MTDADRYRIHGAIAELLHARRQRRPCNQESAEAEVEAIAREERMWLHDRDDRHQKKPNWVKS